MIACDVLIAGGGPAGAIAALELARKGLEVVIADGGERTVHKIGESLPGVGLRLLRSLGIDDSDFGQVHSKVGGNLACWASAELAATDFLGTPDGPGWRLARRRFDTSLLSAATAAGARVFHSDMEHVASTGSKWNARTASGDQVTSRWVVDATGRGASIARQIGVRRVRDEGLVAVWSLGLPCAEKRLERTLIEAAPEGWWYGAVLPDGQAVVALHVRPEDARATRQDWLRALDRTTFIREFFPPGGFDQERLVAESGGGRLESFCGENWLACGDAALSFDPLSSQGIYTAMYSGMAGARAIVAAEADDSSALANYAGRLEEIRRVYRARLADSYGMVSRWTGAAFWASRDRSA